MKRLGGWTSLMSVLVVFAIVSCEEPWQPYTLPVDLTGSWYGTFSTDAYTVSVDINITDQSGRSFDGYWTFSGTSTTGGVHGWAYPGSEGGTIVNFEMTSGNIECCDFFGCFEMPEIQIGVRGYYDNGSITDEYAYCINYCWTDSGTMTLTHLPNP